ncbi:MAG: hypothetical protein M3Z96_00465 [Pseudomonadota bacterium]|nr:hypothetical protein [Pseudomonadota bacterium]MDQ6867239.1 hypothetical protein [Pseudomonadota bacterium]
MLNYKPKWIWLGFASLALSSNVASALSPGSLSGTWNNDATGENITFSGDGDVQDSRLGQGRASSTITYAANLVIAYQQNRYCWYYVTLTNHGTRMNLAVRNKNQSETTCLKGVFNKQSR